MPEAAGHRSAARLRRTRTGPSLAAWIGRLAVPLAGLANLGAYALELWLLEGSGAPHNARTEAWQLVTVAIIIGIQGFWLGWMRRQPIGTLIASVILWSAAVLVGGHDPLAVQPGLVLCLFLYAAERPGALRVGAIVASGLAVFGVLLAAHEMHAPAGVPPWHAWPILVWSAFEATATIGLPAIAGGWYGSLRDRAERIADLAHRAAVGETARTAEAVMAERRSLAGEIHDTSSAHLTALLALAEAAKAAAGTSDPALRKLIAQMGAEGQALFASFERMLNSLRQEDRTTAEQITGHRPGQRVVVEIEELVAEHRAITGVAVALHVEPSLEEIDHRLGPMRSHTAYRVVQEALSNARKHSPGADAAVTVEDDGDAVLIRIENDASAAGTALAHAATPVSLGYGLDGMRDRLVAAGGSLRTGPRRNGGWSVNALLPHPPHRRASSATTGEPRPADEPESRPADHEGAPAHREEMLA